MSVNVYMGIGGAPKELTGVYIGVGGSVKEVQEIYVGIGGVPKLVWQNGLTYTADVSTVTSGGKGTVKGKYKLDGNHVVGTATVTGINGTTDKYLYIPLPKQITTGNYNFTAKLYNVAEDTILSTYSTTDGDATSVDKRVDGVTVSTIRIKNSSGWVLSGDNRKMEITFDYYCLN